MSTAASKTIPIPIHRDVRTSMSDFPHYRNVTSHHHQHHQHDEANQTQVRYGRRFSDSGYIHQPYNTPATNSPEVVYVHDDTTGASTNVPRALTQAHSAEQITQTEESADVVYTEYRTQQPQQLQQSTYSMHSTTPRERQFVVYIKDDPNRRDQIQQQASPPHKRPWTNYFNLSSPPGSKTMRNVYRTSKYQVFSIE